MSASRISLGEVVAATCALLLFVFLFVDWFGGFSAFEAFDVVDVLLAVLALLVIAVVAGRALGVRVAAERPTGPAGTAGAAPAPPAGRVILWAGAIALVLVLAFLFEGEEREAGIFLSLLAALGICAGALMASGELAVVRRPAAPGSQPPRPAEPSPAEPGDRPQT